MINRVSSSARVAGHQGKGGGAEYNILERDLSPAVAIQSIDFSVKSLFMPDSSSAFIRAYLVERHPLKT